MILNGYCTLAEFKEYAISSGAPDAADDAIIESIIEAASRFIDDETGRQFYPRVETRYYSVTNDPQLWLDEDLLEVITLTNGEGTAIAAAEYNLLPRNEYPKYAVRLKSTSDVYWQVDDEAESEYVIPLVGIWGYHELYTYRAWKSATTVVEAGNLNATDLTFTMASAAKFDASASQVIKIENELMITAAINGADLTVNARGDNGSSAATHVNGSAIYIWQPEAAIREACLQICNGVYKRRTGEGVESSSTLTTGGVIITPRDVPDMARRTLLRYARSI